MRDYAIFSPRFWTGETGKELRRLGRDHQVIGAYLFTCSMSNMIGLYLLNVPGLCHEVGNITIEGALEVLRSLSEGAYAHYDPASEYVFLPKMAREQIGERLAPKDKRRAAVIRLLEQARKTPFFQDFMNLYGEPYRLLDVPSLKPLASPSRAPSKGDARFATGSGSGSGVFPPYPPAFPKSPSEAGGGENGWIECGCDSVAYNRWLAYRSQENDVVPGHVRIVEAKFLAGKGDAQQQRAFVEEIVRLRFKRMHDPIRPRQNGPDPKAAKAAREEAEREELERLKAKRVELGIPKFRDPYPGETSTVYDTQMRLAARDVPAPVSIRDLARSKRVG